MAVTPLPHVSLAFMISASYSNPMPWTCPACSSRVPNRQNGDDLPRPGVVYRCNVCRLEVTFDPKLQKMLPAPFPPEPKKSNAA